jgi:DNA polymerase
MPGLFAQANRGLKRRSRSWRPKVIVCLGATAAQSLLGPGFRLDGIAGRILDSSLGPKILATVTPSLLRAPDEAARRSGIEAFIQDLVTVRKALEEIAA